jgi:hypothetical protein
VKRDGLCNSAIIPSFHIFLFTSSFSFFSSEIGELLCMKSKYGPGGEYEPDWYVLLYFSSFLGVSHTFSCRTPPGEPPGPQPPTEPPIPPIPEPTDPPFVRPAWRLYHPRKKRKKEPKAPVHATSVQPPQARPSHMGPSPMDRHLRQQVASWNTWRRKFLLFIHINYIHRFFPL